MSSLVEQVRGVSYKPSDLHDKLNENSVTLLRANNIDDGSINFDDVVYVDRKKVSSKQYLQKGDILICASSGSKNLVGKAAQVDFDGEYTFGAFCKVVRPKNINTKYLGMYFQSPTYRRIISSLAEGANINNIKNENIGNLILNVPDVETIGEVTEIISNITSVIRHRKQELQKLDELIKSRFIEMFGDGKYPLLPVEKICSEIVDCPHTTPKYTGELKNPCIRTSEIKKGYIDWTTMKYVSDEEYYDRISRLAPYVGDIVYGREGTFGNAAILTEGYKFCLGQRVMLLRPDYTICTSEYLLRAIISDDVYRQAKAKNNASTVAHVNVKDVKQFLIPLPPLDLQNQFADFVRQVDKSKAVVQEALDKAQLLFDSLMQEYFG